VWDELATQAAPCPWGQRWWSRDLPRQSGATYALRWSSGLTQSLSQRSHVAYVLPHPPPRGDRLSGVPAMLVVAVVRPLGSECIRQRLLPVTAGERHAERVLAPHRAARRRCRPRTMSAGSVQNLSHFRLAERRPALAQAVMASLICWSFSNSMFRYLLVDHAVPAMWRSLAAARLSAD
jgi:hypothetical protein